MDAEHYTALNRAAWNEIAEHRQRLLFPDAAFFAGGGIILDREPVETLSDVRGRSLVHLQCATGEETLSWANLGARVVGVDIAEHQVNLAQQKAKDAGIDARFLTADVLHLPAEVQRGDFDVVYTGDGVIPWLPDLEPWASGIHRALAPGGRFVLWETHPLLPCLSSEDGHLRVEGDYFGREQVELSRGWRHFPGAAATEAVKAQFTWPLGDVVSALAQTGLRIERLLEYPHRDHHRFPPPVVLPGLPSKYLLVARNA
jgi:SAM-dependent methyltransferase